MKLLLALTFSLVATAAVAQNTTETGTLIRRAPAQIDGRGPDAARRTLRGFGQCVVQRRYGSVREVLAIPVSNEEYGRRMRALATRDCLSVGVLEWPYSAMRGSFFEALFLREHYREPARDVASVSVPDITAGYAAEPDEDARATLALATFGICVARAQTQNSVSLLHADIATPAESELFASLTPTFSGCIPQGVTLRFSRSILRGAIAEGLVRLYDGMEHPAS